MSHTKEVLMKKEAGERLTPGEKMFCRIKTSCCNADIISTKEVLTYREEYYHKVPRTIFICSGCKKELE